jgi:DNA polymerase-3 subunit delta'
MASGDLQGQRAELGRAVVADRVHGAYLFEGPAGTGRRSTALWLARLLVCREPGSGPCERCPDCLRSAASEEGGALGSHADLSLIEPDGAQIKVDQVRALQRELSLAPNEGGRRVAILLGAERLNAAAANSLLKTLEEPPARTTLILVAEHADGLPATVRSRTMRIRFAPEAESAVAAALRAEGLDETDAWLAASLGGGSSASARAWAEENLEAAREIWEALERAADVPPSELLDLAETFRGTGNAARERATLLLSVHGAVARRHVEEAARSGDRRAIDRWLERSEAGERAHREFLRRNLNAQLVVEGLLLDWQAAASR